MSLPAKILALLAVLALTFAIGWGAAIRYRNGQDAEHAKQASETARESERLMALNRTRSDDAHAQALRTVGDRLADALERVRNRPGRLPEPARTACAGATGAELSGADVSFLQREAARADQLRADLDACQTREWDLYEALRPR